MAIQGVGASITSAQLLSQDPQAQGATKAQRAEAERQAKAEQQAKADQTRQKSVVNAQGQVTGSLINITA